jgi:hypothetical protein
MKNRKLPKFKSEIQIYENGDIVTNPYSGETYLLDPVELSIYDYIMGCNHLMERNGGPFSPMTRELQVEMAKGLNWFRKNNAEAYMVLLD